jgi:hypothetical protein
VPGIRCLLVHYGPTGVDAAVGDHDCLCWSVANHSSYVPIQQFAYRDPCGIQMGAPNRAAYCQDSSDLRPEESPNDPRVSALSHFQPVPRCVFAF